MHCIRNMHKQCKAHFDIETDDDDDSKTTQTC